MGRSKSRWFFARLSFAARRRRQHSAPHQRNCCQCFASVQATTAIAVRRAAIRQASATRHSARHAQQKLSRTTAAVTLCVFHLCTLSPISRGFRPFCFDAHAQNRLTPSCFSSSSTVLYDAASVASSICWWSAEWHWRHTRAHCSSCFWGYPSLSGAPRAAVVHSQRAGAASREKQTV